MSLYNLLAGVNPATEFVLRVLGTESSKIPRFRDAYIREVDGVLQLVLLTRTGGGNRDEYESVHRRRRCYPQFEPSGPYNSDLRALPGFLHDEDDEFDATYALWYYQVPDQSLAEARELLDQLGKQPSIQEITERAIAALAKA